jgi:hypothetical protein
MWTADDNARDLIDVTIKGLKTGVMNNRHYMDNVKYEEHLNTKRQNDAMFAEQMTGHPTVVRASTIYTETAESIGSNAIGYQLSDDGKAVMMWNGKLTEIEDIQTSISKRKDISSQDKADLLNIYKMVAGVTAKGSNLAPLLESINARPRLLQLIKKVDGGLAASLATGLKQWNTIEKVSNVAGRFLHAPEDPTVANDFRVLVNNSGLSEKLQRLRQLEVEGKDVSQLTSEILELTRGIRTQLTYTKGFLNWTAQVGLNPNDPKAGLKYEKETGLKSKANPALKTQFKNYLELEEATSNIYKESIKNRRNK